MSESGGRRTKKIEIENVEIHSNELEFCDATDLATDLMSVIASPIGAISEGSANQGDAVSRITRELVGGRLTQYLTRVLASTTVIVKGPGGAKVSLIDSREKLNQAFTGRQKFVFPAVKLALEVSLSGFLDGLALIGVKLPKMPTMQSPSEDSNQSTSATG